METNLNTYIAVAEDAALAAGNAIMDFYHKGFEVQYKGEIDLVTDADRASQRIIFERLHSQFPEHSFFGEENLNITNNPDYKWIIDPLDGTTNFVHGYPLFSVSIALEISSRLKAGVVYAPFTKELFSATEGSGAFLNKRKISVSAVQDLKKSFLVTGFPYRMDNPLLNNLAYFNHLIFRCQALRRDGSAALDLAYLASGRYDGFWELNLAPWDTAAGSIIAREAGATITNFESRPHSIYEKVIVATNGHIHDRLIKEIQYASSAIK